MSKSLSTFQQQALDILRSNKTRQALDLKAEPEKTRTRYGQGWAGQALLAARRLVEAGVGFVTASIGGWDTHGDNFGQLRSTLLPQLDHALSALIHDLDERGLLKETLVYCAGEFGRTPYINGQSGRDHWARAMSVLLAGGRFPRGEVYGATDGRGMEPNIRTLFARRYQRDSAVRPGCATDATLTTPSGRPIAVFGDGVPIENCWASEG